ncbi:uncharacterized protein FOMMEDRAFT_154925 [Fomitiporia mediterranea MF3/22]|uniref:uncharacterized protein n=1 Tax=Fomitiporia mediterranea (strain MF3/22) TaxID=694068 RepID=UPI0004409078|nr:uncharacterized protein FOMMEDRAFT_154925 [Fomitiporia mediterranea MF3/22]EJD03810.1 hypothetical protein FOMMEDRAFT_154925 [Fomitiporia mediterranea MF3/22]
MILDSRLIFTGIYDSPSHPKKATCKGVRPFAFFQFQVTTHSTSHHMQSDFFSHSEHLISTYSSGHLTIFPTPPHNSALFDLEHLFLSSGKSLSRQGNIVSHIVSQSLILPPDMPSYSFRSTRLFSLIGLPEFGSRNHSHTDIGGRKGDRGRRRARVT